MSVIVFMLNLTNEGVRVSSTRFNGDVSCWHLAKFIAAILKPQPGRDV